MAEYQLTATDAVVIRTDDQAHIPNDESNRDWIEYQAWLAEGGVPDPYKKPTTIDASLDSVGTGKTTNQILGAT